jgi:hypothetical protein
MKMPRKRLTIWQRIAKRERGSALLVSLMVIVGLSLLGLGFVALSETEASISVNERNREQTLSHAEAMASLCVDWFQNPTWALNKGLLPSNDPTVNADLSKMKVVRPTIGKVYKPLTSSLLFDLPFKPNADDRLFGDSDHPDVLINDTTGKTFLDNLNNLMFPDTSEAGRITEIRVYAPPIVGGTKVNGYYQPNVGDRYGVATVKVIATKFDKKGNAIAQRAVTEVVTEFPFPGPSGPIQSNASIKTNGSFEVYWGEVSAQLNLTLKNPVAGLPWVDAYHRVEFEYGYDSTQPWTPTHTYTCTAAGGDIVHASAAKLAIDPALAYHAFQCINSSNWTTGAAATEPNWDDSNTTGLGKQYPEGASLGNVWKEVAPKMWPLLANDTTDNTDKYAWAQQMLGYSFPDIWAQSRTRSTLTNCGNNNPVCSGHYNDPTSSPLTTNYTWFQNQTKDQQYDYKIVNFPNFNYQFWKDVALAGDGQAGIFYFKYDKNTALFFRQSDPKTENSPENWANSCTGVTNPLGPGFYFFDSIDSVNPQQNGGASSPNLTAAVDVKSNLAKPCFCFKGFIYLNSTSFGTQGVPKGENDFYNYPGEPFRDVGYRSVDTTTMKFARDGSGNLLPMVNPSIGAWDYQDVNGNLKFDLVVANVNSSGTLKKPDGTALPNPTYMPVEYYEGCTIGTNCSEPHEPYLNVQYASAGTTPASASPSPSASTIGWDAPGSDLKLPIKATDSTNTAVVDCSVAANASKCTSNSYDIDGPLAQLGKGGPMLQGVLYNEGNYSAQGNACYYGSLLINGPVTGTGTPTVYFDESLIKGDFKKKFPNFPRVYVSSYTTEN